MEDYRRVTIMATLYKMYARVMADKLEREVEEGKKVPQNQTRFRKDN